MSRKNPDGDLDQANRKAPHVNPVKSGIRSGNPQLDPEHARKDDPKAVRRGPQEDRGAANRSRGD